MSDNEPKNDQKSAIFSVLLGVLDFVASLFLAVMKAVAAIVTALLAPFS